MRSLALVLLFVAAALSTPAIVSAQTGEKTEKAPAARPAAGGLAPVEVQFAAPDGLMINADLWADKEKTRPFILLCHQARSSRGEYREIAPRLVASGFACLAIDQRSGQGLPDVSKAIRNRTAARARAENKSTDYADAEQDIVAAVVWIRKQGYTGRLTLWGSSYSAALAFKIAVQVKDVDAVIAFSPGEYVGPSGSVKEAAGKLKTPVLIVAPQDEKRQADEIFQAITTKDRTLCLSPHNLHGSRTLFMAKYPQAAWDAVRTFLGRYGRGVPTRTGKKAEGEPNVEGKGVEGKGTEGRGGDEQSKSK